MQQQPLAMNLDRPRRIGSKKKRVLDQRYATTGLNGWVLRKQLMRINKSDLHSYPSSPASRQARRPRDVA
jgi:hypothetical protein